MENREGRVYTCTYARACVRNRATPRRGGGRGRGRRDEGERGRDAPWGESFERDRRRGEVRRETNAARAARRRSLCAYYRIGHGPTFTQARYV